MQETNKQSKIDGLNKMDEAVEKKVLIETTKELFEFMAKGEQLESKESAIIKKRFGYFIGTSLSEYMTEQEKGLFTKRGDLYSSAMNFVKTKYPDRESIHEGVAFALYCMKLYECFLDYYYSNKTIHKDFLMKIEAK